MILILVGQLQTLRVEFGLGEVWGGPFVSSLIKLFEVLLSTLGVLLAF